MKKFKASLLSLIIFCLMIPLTSLEAKADDTNYVDITPEMGVSSKEPVVYTKDSLTTIYNSKLDAYETIHLAPNTAWKTGKIITINTNNNNFMEYYQVSTDGYVKTTDISVVNPDGSSLLYASNDWAFPLASLYGSGALYNNVLPINTSWKIGKVIPKVITFLLPKKENPNESVTAKRFTYLIQVGNDSYVDLYNSSSQIK
ncbi:hypothetical protein [Companilactobacillus mishanensis]|uniref:Surface layer protein A domain-containing protein n=1 Tax=Companilactobacillus mishanensis TaxID=2486008 RepID=A0A5P0ZJ85_9LACO|nr:hypothetical protein [Companilactobacillus mishanensis]MQS53098.1 hypothetical protein [Companilactobacillus mishanensis]